MTTRAQMREAVYRRFITQWGTVSAFCFDNEALKEPANTDWIKVDVRHQPGGQETLGEVGNRKYLRPAIVRGEIHSPNNVGVKSNDTLLETFRTIFEGVSFSGLRFFNVIDSEVGPIGDDYVTLAQAFFEYDETK